MQTFTHTYVLSLAYESVHKKELHKGTVEFIFGNLLPDLMTYIEKDENQKIVHSLECYQVQDPSLLVDGAKFHVLVDHISIKGKPIRKLLDYASHSNHGLLGQLSHKVKLDLSAKIPARRILQAGLEIIILEDEKRKTMLHKLIRLCYNFLKDNYNRVLKETGELYHIPEQIAQFGLKRFLRLYTAEMIDITGSPDYRLMPIAKDLLCFRASLDPKEILEKIKSRPEIKQTVEGNLHLLKNWEHELREIAQSVLQEEEMMGIIRKLA